MKRKTVSHLPMFPCRLDVIRLDESDETQNVHVLLPTSSPDDILRNILCGQRLEPLIDLLRGLFVPPESGDREGYTRRSGPS